MLSQDYKGSFEMLVEQEVEQVLANVVKTNFFWVDWYQGTLYINGLDRDTMNNVYDRLREVYGSINMHRIGDTDEYAFDFVATY
jgi:hypothetical protein